MLVALLVGGATLAVASAPAAAQPPVPGTPTVIDGPSSAIERPAGLGVAIARDGSGGLVYLKAVGGAAHVFVSRLVGGAFQPPVQVDAPLGGASSQPVIAAGNGGVLLVGFINSGQLYVVDGNGAGQFAPPLALASGASNPAISMTNFGKAYLAFTAVDGGGHDVRSAYYYNGQWALEAPPLNALAPADDAGTGTDEGPSVAAAGDGIAIVAWGEEGHIYTRKVWGTSPSVVDEQADAPLPGCTESLADEPVVGAGGTSSYAPVAFHEVLICNRQRESRVLTNLLQGSVYDGIAEADGLSPGSTDGADDPRMAVAEYGQGWITSDRTVSDNLVAASLNDDGVFGGSVMQVNSIPSSETPYAAPAIAGLHANLIAWQQEPGTGLGDIRVRFAPDGSTLGPETVISSPTAGPTDAADGLAAAGDTSGDAAIAWLQGSPGATQVMVNQLYERPGGFAPAKSLAYVKTSQPTLTWPRPSGWGPMSYTVSIDGHQVAQTYSNSFQVPTPLANGPHGWQITATNPAGQQSRAPSATVFVDTVAPTATIKQVVRAKAHSPVRVVVRYHDHPPPGQPAFDASGVVKVVIHWGDGTVTHVRLGTNFLTHVYRRPGRYKLTLLVTDRAGNVKRVVKIVKVFKGSGGHR